MLLAPVLNDLNVQDLGFSMFTAITFMHVFKEVSGLFRS